MSTLIKNEIWALQNTDIYLNFFWGVENWWHVPHPDSQTATQTWWQKSDFFLYPVCDILLIEKRLRRDDCVHGICYFYIVNGTPFHLFYDKNRIGGAKPCGMLGDAKATQQIVVKPNAAQAMQLVLRRLVQDKETKLWLQMPQKPAPKEKGDISNDSIIILHEKFTKPIKTILTLGVTISLKKLCRVVYEFGGFFRVKRFEFVCECHHQSSL